MKHMKHMKHTQHIFDCPNDFYRENGSFSAFKKTGYHPSDHRTQR